MDCSFQKHSFVLKEHINDEVRILVTGAVPVNNRASSSRPGRPLQEGIQRPMC
jgi:hypothetical protein